MKKCRKYAVSSPTKIESKWYFTISQTKKSLIRIKKQFPTTFLFIVRKSKIAGYQTLDHAWHYNKHLIPSQFQSKLRKIWSRKK